MKSMKAILSVVKILFLSALLAVNAVGFHYYFVPVAKDNLNYIPASGKLVFTFNLKSISGKIFELAVFHPDDFETELISKDERKLVLKNSSYGINPFGLVSFFVFPFHEKLVSGASLNLQSDEAFIAEMGKGGFETQKVDGITVFMNGKSTFFVYEKALVILFSRFSESENENLAMDVLQNENPQMEWNSGSDFRLVTQSGLLKNTVFESYFRMLPDYAESLVLEGSFENGMITMNGQLELDEKLDWKDSDGFLTEPGSIEKDIPFAVTVAGKDLNPAYGGFLNSMLNESADTSGMIPELLSHDYTAMKISLDKISLDTDLLSIGADLFSGNWFNPSYQMNLTMNGIKGPSDFYIHDFLKFRNSPDSKRKVNMILKNEGENRKAATFYFHPSRFIENSDLNILLRSVIEPFIIFEEIYMVTERIEDDKAVINGEISFKDKEVHALIQLRVLLKNFTSLI